MDFQSLTHRIASLSCAFLALHLTVVSLQAGPGDLAVERRIANGASGLAPSTLSIDDAFGFSCESVGDIDGDGITDMVVGAPSDDTGFAGHGAIYLLLLNADGTVKSQSKVAAGLNGFASDPGISFFGSALAFRPDVGNNEIPVLAIGAAQSNINATDAGEVILAGINANGTVVPGPGLVTNSFVGPTLTAEDSFGFSCDWLPDLDGDGNQELAVGAPGDDTGGSNRGAVYILFLDDSLAIKSFQKIAHNTGVTLADNDNFGFSCRYIGDIDRDGTPELAVGATGDSTVGTGRGAVHILFLDRTGTSVLSHKIFSGDDGAPVLADSSAFGSSIAALGNIDAEGTPDIAVGAAGDNGAGAMFVLLLRPDGSVRANTALRSGSSGAPIISTGDNFGLSCTLLGDLDGDLVPELAVGSPGESLTTSGAGATHIFSLGDPPVTVTTAEDQFDNPSGPQVSLREAVRDVILSGQFRTINFDPALDGKTIVLDRSIIFDNDSLKITGAGLPDGITITTAAASSSFIIIMDSFCILECLTIRDTLGAIIIDSSQLLLEDSTIQSSGTDSSMIDGGGISVTDSRVDIDRCTFSANFAGRGGAIAVDGSQSVVRILNSTFDKNTAISLGGAIRNADESVTTVSRCTFTENSADLAGGALSTASNKLFVSDCLLAGNISSIDPGLNGPARTLNNSTVPITDLAPLGDYGGKTLTRPPFFFSSAKSSGLFSPNPEIDQRGMPRRRFFAIDTGSTEAIELADVQPDALIGQKPGRQKGNNIYNANAAGQRIVVKLKGKKKSKHVFSIQNDGIFPDTIGVRSNKPNKSVVKLKVFQLTGGRKNVTGALIRGRLSLSDIEPGSTVLFRSTLKSKTNSRISPSKFRITSTSSLLGKSDTVQAKVKSLRE